MSSPPGSPRGEKKSSNKFSKRLQKFSQRRQTVHNIGPQGDAEKSGRRRASSTGAESVEEQLAAGQAVLDDERRYASSVLDVLLNLQRQNLATWKNRFTLPQFQYRLLIPIQLKQQK